MNVADTWATVRQSPAATDLYVRGLLVVAEPGRLLPAHRRLLRLVWRDRDHLRPSLVRQVAELRRSR